CFAFVGRIEPYKNALALVRAFRATEDPALRLVVAGAADESDAAELRAEAAGDSRIRLRLERVADSDLQTYLKAADLVVLPYRRIMHSGSALLALSFGRPVLVPDQGSLAELRAHVGAEWLRLYRGELTGATLREAAAP